MATKAKRKDLNGNGSILLSKCFLQRARLSMIRPLEGVKRTCAEAAHVLQLSLIVGTFHWPDAIQAQKGTQTTTFLLRVRHRGWAPAERNSTRLRNGCWALVERAGAGKSSLQVQTSLASSAAKGQKSEYRGCR